jgi:hypothetical protein
MSSKENVMSTNPTTRSENLLPGDDEVAEEVNLDQQSDRARKVGQLPEEVGGAVGEALGKDHKADGAAEKHARPDGKRPS